MKVEVNENKQERPFPKLMIANNGTIALMTYYGKGVCVKSEFDRIGEYCDGYEMKEFQDFHGSITLRNE